MADISKEIQNFRDAELGEEVRGSMIALAEKVNKDGEDALANVAEQVEVVNDAVDEINQLSLDVAKATEDVAYAVARANEVSDYADQVLVDAASQADASAGSAVLAQSWAEGGTGTREGENANNSKAHAERSGAEADRSAMEADRAARYANIVAPGFLVDPVTMCLYMKTGVGVDFVVADDNILCWKIA